MHINEPVKPAQIWTISPPASEAPKGATIFLKLDDDETVVPVFIDKLESQAILKVWHKKTANDRPLVHQALLSLMEGVGISLLRIEIYDIQDNILRARLLFEGQSYSAEKPLMTPVTPLDACVLAMVAESRVYITETVIEQIGAPADTETDKFRV
jgi:bifunctional DNase/RNase